jgi:hypothetical protein
MARAATSFGRRRPVVTAQCHGPLATRGVQGGRRRFAGCLRYDRGTQRSDQATALDCSFAAAIMA